VLHLQRQHLLLLLLLLQQQRWHLCAAGGALQPSCHQCGSLHVVLQPPHRLLPAGCWNEGYASLHGSLLLLLLHR
jgi:hypothetical protein